MPLAEQGALLVLPRIVELDVLFSESGAPRRRRSAAPAPQALGLRRAQRARVRGRRVAPEGALEVDRPPRAADGQGAPGRAARRGGDPSRRGRALGRGRQLRRAGAGGRLAAPHAGAPRPACGAGRELAPAGSRARADRARRVASGARDARSGGADRPGAARRAPRRRLRPGGSARSSSRWSRRASTRTLVDRVVHRSLAQRRVSVVYVDAPTFAGGRASREPGLLRLQASGVPVAVVRRGDDLRDRARSRDEREAGACVGLRRSGLLAAFVMAWSWLRLEHGEVTWSICPLVDRGRRRARPASDAAGCGSRPSRSRRSSGFTMRSGPRDRRRLGIGSSTASTCFYDVPLPFRRGGTSAHARDSSSSRCWASPSRSRSLSPSAARCSQPDCSSRELPGRRRC